MVLPLSIIGNYGLKHNVTRFVNYIPKMFHQKTTLNTFLSRSAGTKCMLPLDFLTHNLEDRNVTHRVLTHNLEGESLIEVLYDRHHDYTWHAQSFHGKPEQLV